MKGVRSEAEDSKAGSGFRRERSAPRKSRTRNTAEHSSAVFRGTPGKELGKEGWYKIPNGIPGIEDRMPVMYHNGVNSGRISLNRFVVITSTNVAKAMGMYPRKGTISVGSDADIVLWDPRKKHTISAANHHMNVDYNAYEGMEVEGMPVRTIIRGTTVVKDGEFCVEKGFGQFIKRKGPEIV